MLSLQRHNASDRKLQQKFNFFFCNFQLRVSKTTPSCQFMFSLNPQSRNMVESTYIARKYRNVGYYVNFSWTYHLTHYAQCCTIHLPWSSTSKFFIIHVMRSEPETHNQPKNIYSLVILYSLFTFTQLNGIIVMNGWDEVTVQKWDQSNLQHGSKTLTWNIYNNCIIILSETFYASMKVGRFHPFTGHEGP